MGVGRRACAPRGGWDGDFREDASPWDAPHESATNRGDGRNTLGTFHAYEAVWTGTVILATLYAMELPVGMTEAIKISVAPHFVPATS